MSKPTEGPYVHYDDSDSPVYRHTIVAIGKTIAHIYCTKGHEKEDAANARLLAKSWEMRDILKEAVEAKTPEGAPWLVGWRWEEARALLAEIDGDSQ